MTALSMLHFEAGWNSDRSAEGLRFSSASASFHVVDSHHDHQPGHIITAHKADRVAFVRCARTGQLMHHIDLNHHDAHQHLARYHLIQPFRKL